MTLKESIRKIVKEEYPGESHWAAFTRWWLSAEGYDYRANPNQVKFVDGANDGGIDAIALPLEDAAKDTIFIVQSKFYSRSPSAHDLARFIGAVHAIRGGRANFLVWLASCRDNIHSLYEKVRQERSRCRYVVVTPCHVNGRVRRRLNRAHIEVCDSQELRNLEKTYRAGRTPRLSELTLKCRVRPRVIAETSKARVYVFTVKVEELAEAYRRDGNKLFSGNIRYALRGETPKRVRDGINQTLSASPDEFVFSHNGVTVIGRNVHVHNGRVRIAFPSIVNGAQTVSYLGHPRVYLKAIRSHASVMVRLIEVKREERLEGVETVVAYRSNNQNKVDPSDLMVDLPSLVSLYRYLLQHKILLERKKGEVKPHYCEMRITKERMAQVLAASESVKGAAAAKRKQELFSTDAKRLFEEYNEDHDTRLEVAGWVRINSSLQNTLRSYERKARKRRAQLAQFAALTVFGNIMRTLGFRRRLMRAVRAWDSEWELVEEFLYKSFKEILRQLLRCSGKQKKNEPAFYKAQESLRVVIPYATRRAKARVRTYSKKYL